MSAVREVEPGCVEDITIVIPSFNRGAVLVDTLRLLDAMRPRARQIVVVDQTPAHPEQVARELHALRDAGVFESVELSPPSIPAAMNRGLQAAIATRVLFLDDDIIPDSGLVAAHAATAAEAGLVAGQVLQPGERPRTPSRDEAHLFLHDRSRMIDEFMGGNFSVDLATARMLGGFDENFTGAAYRFEAEFAARYRCLRGQIRFEPSASIRHLAVPAGGTRQLAHHLRTASPHHTTGAYYYLLRARPAGWLGTWLLRPIRSVRTRHHLRRPWWIPLSLLAEFRGMATAIALHRAGPRLPLLEPRAPGSAAGQG